RYLESYDWPGNVRELENTIERAVALEPGNVISAERLPERILKYKPRTVTDLDLPEDGIDLEAYLSQLENDYIIPALQRTGGNQPGAAEILSMSVRGLRHLLEKHKTRQTAAFLREASSQ